jgi:hypothetical protein
MCIVIQFNPVETAMFGVGFDADNGPVKPVRVEMDLNTISNPIFIHESHSSLVKPIQNMIRRDLLF